MFASLFAASLVGVALLGCGSSTAPAGGPNGPPPAEGVGSVADKPAEGAGRRHEGRGPRGPRGADGATGARGPGARGPGGQAGAGAAGADMAGTQTGATAGTNTAGAGTTGATAALTTSAGDFTPPTGRLAGANAGSPGLFRLLGATSKDGLRFTPTGRVISDQANVPDIVASSDGTLYLYYTGAQVGGKKNGLGVAISRDKGVTWSHKVVNVAGLTSPGVDPDVAILPDGTFRLWVTSGPTPAIHYADGTDGINFLWKGPSFAPTGGAIDSTTYRVGNTWHMLALDTAGKPSWHATSKDGAVFTTASKVQLKADNAVHFGSNAVSLGSSVRMYSFNLEHKTLSSFVTTDGSTWTAEKGDRISRTGSAVEGAYIKDAAVARLPDGTWFAAYVTPIP